MGCALCHIIFRTGIRNGFPPPSHNPTISHIPHANVYNPTPYIPYGTHVRQSIKLVDTAVLPSLDLQAVEKNQ